MRRHRGSKLVALTAVLTLPLFMGCGDDGVTNGTGGDDRLLGTWHATSITFVDNPGAGDAVVDDGLEFSINFNNEGEYAIMVNNDDPADPWICDGTAFCEWWGTYRATGTILILDEGTADEATATYSISGNTATVTIDDMIRVVLEKS